MRLLFLDSTKYILKGLEKCSEVLGQIHEDFIETVNQKEIQIYTFQEGRGISSIKGLHNKIVDDFSSRLHLPSSLETVATIDANHQDIVRCSDRNDPQDRSIFGAIDQLLNQLMNDTTMASHRPMSRGPVASEEEFNPRKKVSEAGNRQLVPSKENPRAAQPPQASQAAGAASEPPAGAAETFVPGTNAGTQAIGSFQVKFGNIDAQGGTVLILGNGTYVSNVAGAHVQGIQGVKGAKPETTPERRLGPHYIIREPKNTEFVGREPILTQLMEMLYDTQQAYRAVIVGTPGVGKTQVALQLSYSIKDRKWLLVVDIADDAQAVFGSTEIPTSSSQYRGIWQYLPWEDKGRMVLFTTRFWEVAWAAANSGRNVLKLGVMSKEEATQLLRSLIHKDEGDSDDFQTNGAELVRELEYLPAAIKVAAGYIVTNYITVGTYLEHLRHVLPKPYWENYWTWRPLLPHAMHILWESKGNYGVERATLLARVGDAFKTDSRWSEAIECYEELGLHKPFEVNHDKPTKNYGPKITLYFSHHRHI
ncbi:uncharacterized protein CTHT_0047730 [Thermochaetoides thermophila DSM 1495]|uniref:AAA+ ATPase domain-containing protein n=1 Tax=Chaetomium thermophilum (strain DSM 1495 / CBS 144.50 / IMI 039719) TaxID=759272 RepID=G0SAT7_CHATD|nr:hypothetical protein CTHT_0047730 [Thermochaetoides thermophila DSM 1495]EGS19317.1 hypothetical protein CTHT_0047730 [Thermochaetoides thermophila DSM 1495]